MILYVGRQLTRLMDDPTLLGRIARGGRAAAERFRTHAIAARMLADFACSSKSAPADRGRPKPRST